MDECPDAPPSGGMQYERMVEELAKHGIKVSFLKKGLYKQVASKLPEETEIIAAGEGLDSKSANAVPVIVTPEKIYLIKYSGALVGIDLAVIKRDSITSCESSGALLGTLRINTKGQQFIVEKMQAQKAQELASLLA